MDLKVSLKIDRNIAANTDDEKAIVAHYRGMYGQKIALEREQHLSRLQLAEAEFGLSYSEDEISDRVCHSIRPKWCQHRVATWTAVDAYTELIPDAALIKLGVAHKSNFFSHFYIVSPMYREITPVSFDPWLVGRVTGTERWIVVAYWE